MDRTLLILALIALSPPAIPAQQTGQRTSAPARISGHVVTPYAELVADATVSLIRLAPDAPDEDVTCEVTARTLCVATVNMPPMMTTVSDRRGGFTFDVPPGTYALTASKAGYTMREIDTVAYTTTRRVTVEEFGHRPGVELLIRREGGVAGRIMRPDGVPEEGALVQMGRRHGDRLVWFPAFSARSQPDGTYEIRGVPEGEYVVLANSRARSAPAPSDDGSGGAGPAPEPYAATLFPNELESQTGDPVVVQEGVVTTGVDIWLARNPAAFSVSGTVVALLGASVRNITIEYGSAGSEQSKWWTVSNPGGAFSINRLPAGPWQLLARADSDSGPLVATTTIEIAGDSIAGVYLTLAAPGVLSGRVLSESTLQPMVNVRIAAVPPLLGGSPLAPTPAATTGADGEFTMANLLGDYRLELVEAAQTGRVVGVRRRGAVVPDGRVTIRAGEVLDAIHVLVRPTELERLVEGKVETGLCKNASEVVRQGLRILKEHDEIRLK
jgi:hypothetical protein